LHHAGAASAIREHADAPKYTHGNKFIAAMSTKASPSTCRTAGSLALPIFAFYEQQMTALVVLALNLASLSALELGIAQESALAGLNDVGTAKPTASDDTARGL
jgi:hypothetical protein